MKTENKRLSRDEASGLVSRELYAGRYLDRAHELLSRCLFAMPDGSYWADSVSALIRDNKRLAGMSHGFKC